MKNSVSQTENHSKLHLSFQHKEILFTLLLLTIVYLADLFYIAGILRFDMFRSDALDYWNDSLKLPYQLNRFHVPGYPVLLSLFRSATFNLLSPLTAMRVVTFLALLVASYLVYKILVDAEVRPNYASLCAGLFGLFPFVGVLNAIFPIADLVVLMWFLAGLTASLHRRYMLAALLWGITIITHKASIPFVALTWLSQLVFLPKASKRFASLTLSGFVILLPFCIVWLIGATQFGALDWIVASNFQVELASRGSFLIFDGILGNLETGGLTGTSKAMIVLILFIFVSILSILSWKKKGGVMTTSSPNTKIYGLPIALAILLLCAFVNQAEIWAAVRFGRLLVIPLGLLMNNHPGLANFLQKRWGKFSLAAISVVIIASNFFYTWYAAEVFWNR